MEELPKVASLAELTPDMIKQYIKYVAVMRHNQRRWFTTHKKDALDMSKKMEEEIDAFNDRMLYPAPTLFD